MKKLIQIPKSPWDIKPDVLIFSDLHLHEREEFSRIDPETRLNSRLSEGLSILDQIIKINQDHPVNRENPEKFWNINLGDIFELKDRIPTHILLEYQKRVFKIKNYISLIGNHDYNLLSHPTPELFIEEDSHFVRVPQIMGEWGFIPFQRKREDFIHELDKMNSLNDIKIIFFHQELPGGEYESGKKNPGIFPRSLFKPNKMYISGHLHKPQNVGNVMYLGSPYHTSFSSKGSRYVYFLNSKTLEMSKLELDYPKFLSFSIKDLNEDTSGISGNYVRMIGEVEVDLWTPEYKKALKEKFEKAGAKGVSFQVTIKRQHQTKIKEEDVENDEFIIKSYSDENHGTLEQEKLYKLGWKIFDQN